MTQKIATILHINLTDGTFAIKVREDLWPVIGGVGYALFLLKENPATSIIAIGPLTGAFPGCDVAYLSQVDADKEKEEIRVIEIPGELALSLKNLGWDAITIEGQAKKPVQIETSGDTVISIPGKNLVEIKVKSDSIKEVVEKEGYREIYEKVLTAVSAITEKETPLTINLATCLGSRAIYQEIFESIPLAFATLNSLDINYSHEELEEGLEIVYNLKEELKSLI